MDLTKRFEEATAYASVNVNTLEPHKLYAIISPKRIPTKYGLSVVLPLRIAETNNVQGFLPKRYSDVVSDADIDAINSKQSHYISCTRGYANLPNPTSWPLNLKYILSPHTESTWRGCRTEKDWRCELCKRPATDWTNSVYKLCTLNKSAYFLFIQLLPTNRIYMYMGVFLFDPYLPKCPRYRPATYVRIRNAERHNMLNRC